MSIVAAYVRKVGRPIMEKLGIRKSTGFDMWKMYRKALNHYGPNLQKGKAIEELDELRKEILQDMFSNGRNRDRVLYEMADVMNIIYQIRELHRIGDRELLEVMNRKMIRTMERIDKEVATGTKSYYECEVD